MDNRTFIESVQADLRADLAAGRAKLELVDALENSVLWAKLCKVPREKRPCLQDADGYWEERDARRSRLMQESEEFYADNRRW